MKYKCKCSSSRELVGMLEEVVQQIQRHQSLLIHWQEVPIPDQTWLKVRLKEKADHCQLKLKIEWGEEQLSGE